MSSNIPIGFSGLVSGLDWDSLIQKLMQVARQPEVLIQNQQNTYTTQKQDWDNLSQKLSALQTSMDAFSSLNADTTFQSKTATSSDTTIFTATATSQAANAVYTLSNIVTAKGAVATITTNTTLNNTSGTITFNDTDSTNSSNNTSVTVNISNANSLSDIANAINNTQGINVNATVINGDLVVTDKNTGSNHTLTISTDISALTLPANASTGITGSDASFTLNFNGASYTIQNEHTNTITDAISGVTINLLQDSPTNTTPAPTYTLTIANDTKKAEDAITSFVNSYNDVMGYIASLQGDNGDLKGNFTLSEIQSNLQYKIMGSFGTGKYNSLAQIGITTNDSSSSLGFNMDGKLSLDTSTLESALQNNPQAVENLFSQIYSALSDSNNGYITNLIQSTGSGQGLIPTIETSLQNSIDDISNRIADMETNLALQQQNLQAQFTAMEAAIAQFKSQGSWLAQQVAALPTLKALT